MRARPVVPLVSWLDADLPDAVPNASPMQVIAELATIVTAIRGQGRGSAARTSVATRHFDRFQGGNRGL
jgi:hypothetical protein